MESRKSYLTTQLNKCDYRSGSRCRYYQGRDDGRSLQEAVNAFQGSFVEEHIGTEFPLLCTSEYEVQRGGERPDSYFSVLWRFSEGVRFHCWVLNIVLAHWEQYTFSPLFPLSPLLLWGGSCSWLVQKLPLLPCWRGWNELTWDGDVILHTYPN